MTPKLHDVNIRKFKDNFFKYCNTKILVKVINFLYKKYISTDVANYLTEHETSKWIKGFSHYEF